MRAGEYLQRSIVGRRRLRAIDAELTTMRDRCTVGGHRYHEVRGVGTWDPMRHVDALIDASEAYRAEREACEADIEEARYMCRGAAEIMGTGAKVLELHYCDGWGSEAIARYLRWPHDLCERVIAEGPALLDGEDAVRMILRGKA